jgi:beta-glucosidase
MGLSGFVLSDYGANHSAGPALQAGMDLEFFGTHFLQLKALIQSGAVPVAALDAAVGDILTTMDQFGLLAHASPNGGTVVNRPLPEFPLLADAQQALTIAEQGAVLLRNQGNTLPLTQADLRSLAVIGTTARTPLVGGGGSSRVIGVTEREISPLTALQQAAGPQGNITFAVGRDLQGVAVPNSAVAPPNAPAGQHGLLRTNTVIGATQVDPNIDFVGPNALPEGTQATWTGTITAPTTGNYLLAVQTDGTGGTLTVDGQPVITSSILAALGTSLHRTTDGLANSFVQLDLTAGLHTIAVAAAPVPAFPPFIQPAVARYTSAWRGSPRSSVRPIWRRPSRRRSRHV